MRVSEQVSELESQAFKTTLNLQQVLSGDDTKCDSPLVGHCSCWQWWPPSSSVTCYHASHVRPSAFMTDLLQKKVVKWNSSMGVYMSTGGRTC